MNKNFIFSLVVSLLVHTVALISFESRDSSKDNTYALVNGVAKTKISIRILNTIPKIDKSKGNVKKKKTKNKKQKITSSGSKASKSSGNKKALSRYLSAIRKQMVLNQYKSKAATRLRQKGVVKISFNITAPNIISDITVLKPSKYEQLNYSATRTVKSLDNIPSIPNELNLANLSVQIDITYQ